MTVPTTAPRRAGGARWAANGTTCCATVLNSPISRDATSRAPAVGATAAAAMATANRVKVAMINPRRSTMSARGTSRNRPAA